MGEQPKALKDYLGATLPTNKRLKAIEEAYKAQCRGGLIVDVAGIRLLGKVVDQITSGFSKSGIRKKKSLMKEDDVGFLEVVAHLIIRCKKRGCVAAEILQGPLVPAIISSFMLSFSSNQSAASAVMSRMETFVSFLANLKNISYKPESDSEISKRSKISSAEISSTPIAEKLRGRAVCGPLAVPCLVHIMCLHKRFPCYASDPHSSMKAAAEELAIFVSGCPENCAAAIRSFTSDINFKSANGSNSKSKMLAAVEELFSSCGDVMMQIDIAETLYHCLSFDKANQIKGSKSILCRHLVEAAESQAGSSQTSMTNAQESLASRLKKAVVATNVSLSRAATVATVQIDTLHFNIQLKNPRRSEVAQEVGGTQDVHGSLAFNAHAIDFGLRSFVITIQDDSSSTAVPELVEVSYSNVFEWKVSQVGADLGSEKRKRVTLILNSFPNVLREFPQVVERWGEVDLKSQDERNVVMEIICDVDHLCQSICVDTPSVSAALHKIIKGFPAILTASLTAAGPEQSERPTSPCIGLDLPDWVVDKLPPNEDLGASLPSPDTACDCRESSDPGTDWNTSKDDTARHPQSPSPSLPLVAQPEPTKSNILSKPKAKPKRLAGMRTLTMKKTGGGTPGPQKPGAQKACAPPCNCPPPRAKAQKGRQLQQKKEAPHAPTPAMNVGHTAAGREPEINPLDGGMRRSSRSAAAAATRKLNATLCALESGSEEEMDDVIELEPQTQTQAEKETELDLRPHPPPQADARPLIHPSQAENAGGVRNTNTPIGKLQQSTRKAVGEFQVPAPKLPVPEAAAVRNSVQAVGGSRTKPTLPTVNPPRFNQIPEPVQAAGNAVESSIPSSCRGDPDFALYLSDEEDELSLGGHNNRGEGQPQGWLQDSLEHDGLPLPHHLFFANKNTPRSMTQQAKSCQPGETGGDQQGLGLLNAMSLLVGNDVSTPSPAPSNTAGMYNNILSHLIKDQEKEARARYSANLESLKKWAKRQLAAAKRHTAAEMEHLEKQKASRLKRVQVKVDENTTALLKLKEDYQQRLDVLSAEKRCLLAESQTVTEEFDREMQKIAIQGKRKAQEAFGRAEAAIQEEKQAFEQHISKARRMHTIISTVLPLCT